MSLNIRIKDTLGELHSWKANSIREYENLVADMASGRALKYIDVRGDEVALNALHVVSIRATENSVPVHGLDDTNQSSITNQSGDDTKA